MSDLDDHVQMFTLLTVDFKYVNDDHNSYRKRDDLGNGRAVKGTLHWSYPLKH